MESLNAFSFPCHHTYGIAVRRILREIGICVCVCGSRENVPTIATKTNPYSCACARIHFGTISTPLGTETGTSAAGGRGLMKTRAL